MGQSLIGYFLVIIAGIWLVVSPERAINVIEKANQGRWRGASPMEVRLIGAFGICMATFFLIRYLLSVYAP